MIGLCSQQTTSEGVRGYLESNGYPVVFKDAQGHCEDYYRQIVLFSQKVTVCISGHYMYIETSAPRKQGDKARLLSEDFAPTTSSGRCLKFWYHMYGATIGTLRILVKTGPGNQSETAIWELSGNFGNQWYSGQAPVTSGVMYQVTHLEGITVIVCSLNYFNL